VDHIALAQGGAMVYEKGMTPIEAQSVHYQYH